jgi:hypothetical protein
MHLVIDTNINLQRYGKNNPLKGENPWATKCCSPWATGCLEVGH